MGVTRRFIFPTIRIVLWALIAAALVKLAFLTVPDAAADPAAPSLEISEPRVQVAAGTITNTVTVTGSITADAASDVKATMAGTVTSLATAVGKHVDAGSPILVITLETPVEPTVTTNPDTGEQTVKENKPKVTRTTVTAPVTGTVATLTALKDQVVAVGDVVASVSPGTLSVTATLQPAQQYRLLTAPTEALVTVTGGPAPFTCTALRLGAAPSTGSGNGGGNEGGNGVGQGGGQSSPSASLTCAIPAGVTVFTGMAAQVAISAGAVADVPVVPVTAVQGSVQNGVVWKVAADGEPAEQKVTLGLTDGEQVQVVDGLALGDSILEYVPVGDVVVPGSAASGCSDPTKGC